MFVKNITGNLIRLGSGLGEIQTKLVDWCA